MKIKTSLADKMGEVEGYFLFEKESFPEEIKNFEGYAKKEEFEGKQDSVFVFNEKERKVIVVGLGKKKEFRVDYVRSAVSTVLGFAKRKKVSSLSLTLPEFESVKDIVMAIGEVVVLSSYKLDIFKSKKKKEEKGEKEEKETLKDIYIREKESEELKAAITEGEIKAGAQNYVSSITDLPANILNPLEFVKRATELAKENNLSIEVFDKKKLEELKMNAILGVNQGSAQPPAMVILEYNKDKTDLPLYAIVGKGITFDTGGISLKPPRGMEEMKYDATGACVVLGTTKGVAELNLPIRLVSVMPLTENMPGGNAQRPGDIVTAYNGKTIEVINTDAEGRLILADALSYVVAEKKPDYMIDVATLTGAVIVCLGKHAIGLMGTDDRLQKVIEEAGEYTHERVWKLPLWKEYSKMIESELADIKNIGSERGEAGTITAAAFLKEFVGDTKWAHLDIAATDHVSGHRYLGTRASGMGARLLIETLKRLPKK
uniref:Probable cytosol aminopeptidase n=1 Tax=uncultured marine group II/III euryarchaeote KM3_195_B08 TaxID=1457970 RepID=A0A075GWV8_9EURY|nr:leucyl aminopeptidase (CARP, pepA) [uncultured marine group II/III euryarchaeote KM3_195_B08]